MKIEVRRKTRPFYIQIKYNNNKLSVENDYDKIDDFAGPKVDLFSWKNYIKLNEAQYSISFRVIKGRKGNSYH